MSKYHNVYPNGKLFSVRFNVKALGRPIILDGYSSDLTAAEVADDIRVFLTARGLLSRSRCPNIKGHVYCEDNVPLAVKTIAEGKAPVKKEQRKSTILTLKEHIAKLTEDLERLQLFRNEVDTYLRIYDKRLGRLEGTSTGRQATGTGERFSEGGECGAAGNPSAGGTTADAGATAARTATEGSVSKCDWPDAYSGEQKLCEERPGIDANADYSEPFGAAPFQDGCE